MISVLVYPFLAVQLAGPVEQDDEDVPVERDAYDY
jgi:hypothetical protein